MIAAVLLAGAMAASPPPAASWRYSRTTDPFTDAVKTRAWVEAPGAVLSVRCSEGRVETYLTVAGYLGKDDADVRYRVDKGEVFANVWDASTDGTGVFAPHPSQTARHFAGGYDAVIEVTDYADTPRSYRIPLGGSNAAITRVLGDCAVPRTDPRETDPEVWRRVADSIDDGTREDVALLQSVLNLLTPGLDLAETGRRDRETYRAASAMFEGYWQSCESGAAAGALCERWRATQKYDAGADYPGDIFEVAVERMDDAIAAAKQRLDALQAGDGSEGSAPEPLPVDPNQPPTIG